MIFFLHFSDLSTDFSKWMGGLWEMLFYFSLRIIRCFGNEIFLVVSVTPGLTCLADSPAARNQ